ncbi:MAG TPA: hypothetical protein VN678_12690 [Acidobacteriaceae bacterium]|nr:hypothetical protein [Acidobacteriaceae bacterium]
MAFRVAAVHQLLLGSIQYCYRGRIVEPSFQERYASLSDDELLHVAGDRRDLLEHAAAALDAEMARRGLTYEQARAKKREHRRREFDEMNSEIVKRSKSKYFVAQISLPGILACLAGEAIFLILLPSGHPMREAWLWPLIAVYMGAFLTILVVQEWVRWTVSFWVSLVVSLVPQFLVARWLAVYHPSHSRGGERGAAFLSLFAGWLVGVPLFLLLQKLKSSQNTDVAQ